MKKLKAIAAVALAAVAGAATLTACSGKNLGADKFKIADYAHPLNSVYAQNHLTDYADSQYVNDAYTGMIKKNYASVSAVSSSGNNVFANARVETKDGQTTTTSYTFYDVRNDRELFTGLYTAVEYNYFSSGHYGSLDYYTLVRKSLVDGGYNIQYAGPDGRLLTYEIFSSYSYYYANDINLRYFSSYKDGDGTWLDFFKMTYTPDSGTEEVVKYFCYSKDADGEMIWKEVTEEALEEPETESDSDYKAGTQLGLTKVKIDANNEDYPVNNYKGIEYTVEGGSTKTYTFYKNNSKLSSISVADGDIIGYVGDYVYYTEREYVSADATKGYNFEVNAGEGTVIKVNVKLYRYNFIKDKGLKEIKMDDYVIIDGQELYNYSSKKFDAFIAGAYKTVNGVAVATSNPSLVVLNEKGKVIADLSGTEIYNLNGLNIYKLANNRFLAGSSILDSKSKVVAHIPFSATVWAEKQLIYCSNNMFIDYNGKVVIEPAPGRLYFYGDAAYSSSDDKIHNLTNPSGVELKDVISINEENGEVAYISGGLIIKRTPVKSGLTAYNYTIYNLSGEQLGVIENVTSPTLDFKPLGGKLVASGITVLTNFDNFETQQVSLIIA